MQWQNDREMLSQSSFLDILGNNKPWPTPTSVIGPLCHFTLMARTPQNLWALNRVLGLLCKWSRGLSVTGISSAAHVRALQSLWCGGELYSLHLNLLPFLKLKISASISLS